MSYDKRDVVLFASLQTPKMVSVGNDLPYESLWPVY